MFNSVEGNRLLRFGGIALIVLIAFLAVQVLYTLKLTAHVGENTPPMNIISVTGRGEVFAKPDVATFTFGAQQDAATVSAAQQIVTDKINKAIDILKASGIEEKDIKTIGYNIYPHYKSTQTVCNQFGCPPGREVVDGYEVSQMIEVKVRETAKAGEILGKLGTAQLTNISGLSFTIDDSDAVQAQAQEKAIQNAREKAKKLARDLGVRLGDIVSFGDYGYPMPYYETMSMKNQAMDAAASPQVPSGENQIVSNVTITYEIR